MPEYKSENRLDWASTFRERWQGYLFLYLNLQKVMLIAPEAWKFAYQT